MAVHIGFSDYQALHTDDLSVLRILFHHDISRRPNDQRNSTSHHRRTSGHVGVRWTNIDEALTRLLNDKPVSMASLAATACRRCRDQKVRMSNRLLQLDRKTDELLTRSCDALENSQSVPDARD